jgi:hypothetical protein
MMKIQANYLFLLLACAAPAAASDLTSLCQSEAEGSYFQTLPDHTSVRINLFCIDEARIMASISGVFNVEGVPRTFDWAYLSNSASDGPDLILSNFQTGDAERHGGSSKSTVSYLRVNADDLVAGKANGFYTGRMMDHFLSIHASKIQSYPRLLGVGSQNFSKEAVRGVFQVSDGKLAKAKIVFDVLANTPVVTLTYSDMTFHFTDGAKWDGSGAFSVATPEGNGGEADDHVLNYIRGHFIDANTIEFIQVNSLGLYGQFKAIRVQ